MKPTHEARPEPTGKSDEGSTNVRPLRKWAAILPILLGLLLSALPLIALGAASALSLSPDAEAASICLGLPLAWIVVYLLMGVFRAPRYVAVLFVSVPAMLCLVAYLIAAVLVAVEYSASIFGG